MDQYADYAEFYDLGAGGLDDVPFYLEYARQCGGPILELACGTGRILIPIAEAGYEIYGVDLSVNMLDRCKQRVAEHGVEVDRATVERGYRRYALDGLVMAIGASQVVGQTERGDEMFLVMASGSAALGRRLDVADF